MPRKPKRAKQTITVLVDGTPITVILHPPTGTRKSWYAYWPGLVASKSTGQSQLKEAAVVADSMVKSWKVGHSGRRLSLTDTVLTDEEFDRIQQVHFLVKKQDPLAQTRAKKTHKVYIEAAAGLPGHHGPEADHAGYSCRL